MAVLHESTGACFSENEFPRLDFGTIVYSTYDCVHLDMHMTEHFQQHVYSYIDTFS